jgi:hypothetical protein
VSSSKTDGADVLAAAVEVVASSAIDFSSATTDGTDVLAGQTSIIVAASSANTDGADVLAGQVGVLVGVSSVTTDGADVLSANVEVVAGSVSFSAAITDGPDVMAGRIQKIEGGHFGGDRKKHKSEIKKRDEKLKEAITDSFERVIEGKKSEIVVKGDVDVDNPPNIEQFVVDYLKSIAADAVDEDDEEALLLLM